MTLSVDASSKGFGAVILQNGLPVAYASKALTPSQQHYAQIEKEIIALSLIANVSTIICMRTGK